MSGGNVNTMRLRGGIAAAAGIVAATLCSAPHVAAAQQYSSGGVSAGPLHWDPSNPATRNYYIPTISVGETFSDFMRVQNPNPLPVQLYVNAVDGITAIPSGAVYANRTDPVQEDGAWVTPSVSQLTLAAGASTLVGFTVHVPAAAVPGDHLAGLAFENSHPEPGSGSIAITSITRTVVGVLIEVPGPASFAMSIGGVAIKPLTPQGLASVVITLSDTGRKLGRPKLAVTLDGPHHYHRMLSRQLDTILPGDTIPYPFPWPDTLTPGTYTVTVVATAPGMTPVTYTATVALGTTLQGVPSPSPSAHPAGAAAPVHTVSVTPGWLMPVLIAGAGLLLALMTALATLTVAMRRQRRSRSAEQQAASGRG